MKVGEYFCVFLNNFFPKRKLIDRDSPRSYSEGEYRGAPSSLALYTPYINLEGKTVLDAGCGLGGKTVFYAEHGCKSIIGIDMDEWPRIESVKPLKPYVLEVTFRNGVTKRYDCSPLLQEEAFAELSNKGFFSNVQVEKNGYAVIWNDRVDLSEAELWVNGSNL